MKKRTTEREKRERWVERDGQLTKEEGRSKDRTWEKRDVLAWFHTPSDILRMTFDKPLILKLRSLGRPRFPIACNFNPVLERR